MVSNVCGAEIYIYGSNEFVCDQERGHFPESQHSAWDITNSRIEYEVRWPSTQTLNQGPDSYQGPSLDSDSQAPGEGQQA